MCVNREWNENPMLLKSLLQSLKSRVLPRPPLNNYEVNCGGCGETFYAGNGWQGMGYKVWHERLDGSIAEHRDLGCFSCMYATRAFSPEGTDLTFLLPAQDMVRTTRVLDEADAAHIEAIEAEQNEGYDEEGSSEA